jgi:hypothetical protein
MNWLLIILVLNVANTGWEGHAYEFKSKQDCLDLANEINNKQYHVNDEANRDGRVVIEQMYAWCEKIDG